MNTRQLHFKSLQKLKKLSPNAYNEIMNVAFPFYMLSSLLYNKGEDVLRDDFNLTQTQLDVLISLYYASEDFTLTPSSLYEILSFSSGGMTKVLKALESKRYISRQENKQDKRSKLVKITDLGKIVAEKAIAGVTNIDEQYFSKLDKKEQKVLVDLIYKILS